MKKLMMFAAAALLMAGMMVSCKPKDETPNGIAGFVKKDIQSIPEQVIGQTEADAKKALLDAGFKEAGKDILVAARSSKKMAHRMPAKVEPVVFSRTLTDGYDEIVAFGCVEGAVFGVEMAWTNKSIADQSAFMDAIQQGFVASYNKSLLPNFYADLRADEFERSYVEGKYADEINEAMKEIEDMFKSGDIDKATYEMYKEMFAEENQGIDAGGFATFMIALKALKFEEKMMVNSEFTDDKAYAYITGESKETNGLLKALDAEMSVKDGIGLIMFHTQKDHLDELRSIE